MVIMENLQLYLLVLKIKMASILKLVIINEAVF